MDIDLDLARIEEASRVVDPAFRDSPQFVSELLCAALGRNVLVKIETANPLGSFKGDAVGSWSLYIARCSRAPLPTRSRALLVTR
jgi:threonine dehydratase